MYMYWDIQGIQEYKDISWLRSKHMYFKIEQVKHRQVYITVSSCAHKHLCWQCNVLNYLKKNNGQKLVSINY